MTNKYTYLLIADRVEGREGVPHFPRSQFWKITLEIDTLLFVCLLEFINILWPEKINTKINANINVPPDFF